MFKKISFNLALILIHHRDKYFAKSGNRSFPTFHNTGLNIDVFNAFSINFDEATFYGITFKLKSLFQVCFYQLKGQS